MQSKLTLVVQWYGIKRTFMLTSPAKLRRVLLAEPKTSVALWLVLRLRMAAGSILRESSFRWDIRVMCC